MDEREQVIRDTRSAFMAMERTIMTLQKNISGLQEEHRRELKRIENRYATAYAQGVADGVKAASR